MNENRETPEEGITNGTSTTAFSPYETCTVAQILTFLWRSQGEPAPKGTSSFTNLNTAEYYAKAVSWAVNQGGTNGTSPTTFSPGDTCTRGEIVTFLYRAYAD